MNVFQTKLLRWFSAINMVIPTSIPMTSGVVPNVLSYLRSYQGKAVLVALNMSSTAQRIRFDLAKQGFATAKLKPLAASLAEAAGSEVSLQPFGAFVGEVVK